MYSRLLRRAGATAAMTAGLVLATGGTAFAHECYNVSRSAQGNASAGSNSQAWYTLVVADAIQGDVASGTITQAQADCIKGKYAASGAPASFTMHVKGATGQNGTIGANNPNEDKASDGKGIDHVFDVYGGVIFGAYAECGASLEL